MNLPPPLYLIRGDDGEDYGPVSLTELREWVRENRAGLGTRVKKAELHEPWQHWQNYPELVGLLAEVQAKSPIPGLAEVEPASLVRRVLALFIDFTLGFIMSVPFFEVYVRCLPQERQQAFFNFAQANDIAFNNESFSDYFSFSHLSPSIPIDVYVLFWIVIGVITLYMAGFQYLHGKTPGKAIFGLRLINEQGQKPSLLQALLHSVLVVLFSLFLFPFFLIFALSYVIVNPSRRAFHDLMAGTYVIKNNGD